jgi:DUF971 family protein
MPAPTSPDHRFPVALTVHQQSRVLEVEFDDGRAFRIPFELMRVYSPSAEVQGHGPGQETLQTGKRDVVIDDLDAVGHYAVKPTFSDGHDTGLFTWDYLYRLGSQQDALFAQYLERLAAAGLDRDADMTKPAGGACHSH